MGGLSGRGGECPVKEDVVVEVYLRKGRSSLDGPKEASYWDWSVDGDGGDIMKYRLHKPEQSIEQMCSGVTEQNKHAHVDVAPTIEQLAADYKAKLAIAQQAQEEAYSRRDEAEAALEKLYKAGLEIGIDIAIASKEDEDEGEPELVITDWQDLRVGDEVECVEPNIRKDRYGGQIGVVCDIDESDSFTPVLVSVLGSNIWCNEVKFIRRP